MKRIVGLLIVLLISGMMMTAKADQLAYITKEQALEAAKLLQKKKKVILWCACCEDVPVKYKIQTINVKHTGYEDYYEVVITAKNKETGEIVEEAIDLAYVHIKVKKNAVAVGSYMEYECDPCTEPFSWKKK